MSSIPERTRVSAPERPARRTRPVALVAGATLALGLPVAAAVPPPAGAAPTAPAATAPVVLTAPAPDETFHRLATYPVFHNRPAAATVAEISAVSEDGRTVVHTDALARRIGFLDITDPSAPRGLGTLSLAELGSDHDEPTSVAVVGSHVLVVVDSSVSLTAPSG